MIGRLYRESVSLDLDLDVTNNNAALPNSLFTRFTVSFELDHDRKIFELM